MRRGGWQHGQPGAITPRPGGAAQRPQAISCSAMGAIKPWHVMTLGCVVMVVLVAIVAAVIVVMRRE
jgi:hypothetical protein